MCVPYVLQGGGWVYVPLFGVSSKSHRHIVYHTVEKDPRTHGGTKKKEKKKKKLRKQAFATVPVGIRWHDFARAPWGWIRGTDPANDLWTE